MSQFEKNKNRIRLLASIGICAASAMVLAYVEFLLPPIYAPLPAVKCGLANIAVLFILYKGGGLPAAFILYKGGGLPAALVSAVKVSLTALLFGSFMSLAYSTSGAALSLVVMILLRRTDRFTPLGVSVAGAIAHNAGQVAVAAFITGTPAVTAYFIPLMLTGCAAGIAVGLLGGILLKHVKV